MRCFFLILVFGFAYFYSPGQEYFYIKDFDVNVKVNKDASLDINEKISVHFTSPRHGIFRQIPVKYKISELPEGTEKALMAWKSGGYRYVKIKNIKVSGFSFKAYDAGNYKTIRIGSENKYVEGDQVYEISYTLLGAINFFSDFSELYLNITGNEWPVVINRSRFTVQFYQPLKDTTQWFISSGRMGSVANATTTTWADASTLKGHLDIPLRPYEGVTIGARMANGFLVPPDYKTMGAGWLLLPVFSFLAMFFIWKRWGKDLPVTVRTEFYPPQGISPSVAGYLIDGKLDRRDLTALIPYWGAKGFLKVEETEKRSLLGLIKNREYKFIRLKPVPPESEDFERTMFNGLFDNGDEVFLSDLENSFYKTMNEAKLELREKINREKYYTRYTRTFTAIIPVLAAVIFVLGIINLISQYPLNTILWSGVAGSSVIVFIFGMLMEKKTEKGTRLYEELLGFKDFIKSVEKDRLQEFLKQDENYFDKVLPFAIVFDVADTWKDKLKGLEIPPPSWYSGFYGGENFSTLAFMNNMNKGLNSMSKTFYSTPSSTGSSGGSFGGGGSSGGGFGGGGGGSW